MDAFIFLLVGGSLITIGIFRLIRTFYLTKHGCVAKGVVCDIVSDPNDLGGANFYPIVSFPVNGSIVTERYSVGFSFKLYSKGSNVRVIYDPDDPSKFIIDSLVVKILCCILIVAGGVICTIGVLKF